MKILIFYIIIAILSFSIYGAFDLSMIDFSQKDVCPKLAGIPACYLVLLFFIIGLLTHVLQTRFSTTKLYYLAIAFPFFMALSGTITEMGGTVICPRTPGGTPMCFISLGICSALLILKWLELKTKVEF